MVPFSLKLEVKDANRNSTGRFSKVYGTSHPSIRISLAFEASVPPLLSVQRDPKSGSWLPPGGVFSKDATCQCPYLLHDSSTSLLLGQLCWPLPPLLESRLLPFSIGTGVFAGLCPWDSHSLEAGVTGEEVLRSFPCSVVWNPSLHFAIAFSCKQDDLHTPGCARRLTSGGASIVPVSKIQIFSLLQIPFLHLGYRGQYLLGLGRIGLLQEFTCWRTRKPPRRKGYISQRNLE